MKTQGGVETQTPKDSQPKEEAQGGVVALPEV